ncbi:MAG: phospho-sugar mutase [Saprospirales bacterium]|nr:MAG: phospho-sugar mutase [Saprospirales bacterium]
MKLEPGVKRKIDEWLSGPYDRETKNTLQSMVDAGEHDKLTDAFYRDLEFGTGGLRGIMGVGTNRINKYTLGAATQGLSNYLKGHFKNKKIRVALAHDNRNNARKFANIVADVFSANGIEVFFFDALRPTPELSFAIRHLNCQSGVMLTASHNPREYSGYKAYWSDGGQVIPPHDKNIISEVKAIKDPGAIQFERQKDLVKVMGAEMDVAFLRKVREAAVFPEVVKKYSDMPIVFSPIHGASVDMVPAALGNLGFSNVHLVEEQCTTDGNFPTVVYPNPEEEEAMTLSIKKAKEVGAELAMACDPDGDRVGIAVKHPSGKYVLLNGNQTATLVFHYVMNGWKSQGKLSGNEYIIKTIVTTFLLDKMAEKMGIKCYNTLTGFKWIGSLMTKLEGKEQFLVGGEESYGYLIGDHVRDKDAVVSCAIIAEMAAWYRDSGKTLYEALVDIHGEFGLYREKLISFTKKGKEGAAEISAMMESLRKNPPSMLDGEKITLTRDYLSGMERNLLTGEEQKLDFPQSNVLQFVTEKETVASARPSGTEPKIKFYISTNRNLDSSDTYEHHCRELDQKIDRIKDEFIGEKG